MLMKLVFDLKISREAQTHRGPTLGIQALRRAPPAPALQWRGKAPDVIAGSVRGEIAGRKKVADNQKSIFSWTSGAFSPRLTLAN